MDTSVELFLNLTGLVITSIVRSSSEVVNIGLVTTSVVLILRSYKKYVSGIKFQGIDLSGKVFIITGSNTGIGLETAYELVNLGATVILACRSLQKAEQAKNEIVSRTQCSPKCVITMELDLCSFDSIRSFVRKFTEQKLRLHCLINNAGLMCQERTVTKEGLETVFTANHLGPFLLTNLLLPALEKTKGRVVMLSSSLHFLAARVDLEDVMCERPGAYSLFGAYGQSKLAGLLYTMELQRRLWAQGSKVTVNAVHPGLVRTDIPRNMSPLMRTLNAMFSPIFMVLQKSPNQGAFCTVHAAINPEWEGVGGKYISNCAIAPCSAACMDTEAAKKLWVLSESLTAESSMADAQSSS